MFRTLNGLLNTSKRVFPNADSDLNLANDFLSFFVEKVERIRSQNSADVQIEQEPAIGNCNLASFRPLSTTDVETVIGKMSNKSCVLDTLPAWLIKDNLQYMLPIITRIINTSLSSGIFPETLKLSLITPVIKKMSMDANLLKSYRPVANIKFIGKVIEKAASCQVIEYVSNNNLGEIYQSAYKAHHSTETALLQVKNYIMDSLDSGKAVLLVLLDMTAAFDTVDHAILTNRLQSRFGVTGSAIEWFRSYLKDRRMKVMINNDMSVEHVLNYSVPQGSIVGPQGFIMYTHPVGDIIRKYNIVFHSYADDTQLLCKFDPKIPGDCDRALLELSKCIQEIGDWMHCNRLQLNQQKTEFMVIASSHVLNTLPPLQLDLGHVCIQASSSVKNLGVIIDSTMTMSEQVNSICRGVNFHIRNLWRIRRFLTRDACHHAVRALVLSRIDYANSLLFGAKEFDLTRLQRLQNKAARLVFACGMDQSSTALLTSLHWLPVRERIKFKLLLYIFKSLHINQAPCYLSHKLVLYNDPGTAFEGRRRLRSSTDTSRLVIPRTKRTAGDKAFQVAGPKIWNQLPNNIRDVESVLSFKGCLKSYLFPKC